MLAIKNYLFMIIVLSLFSFNTYSRSNNSVDATSSASRKFKIAGGTVGENSAIIKWSGKYDNGTLEIKWGTSPSNLTNTKSMYPYTRGTTAQVTLGNLNPGTKYYYRVDGTYKGRTYNNLMNGSFITADKTASAITSFITHNMICQTIAVSRGTLRTNLLFVPGDIVNILDSRGALVKKIYVNSFCRQTDISFLGNGYYIFNLSRNSKIIHQIHGSKIK